MRIISKFRDYYDSVQAYGQDKKLVYLRETKELETLPQGFHVGRSQIGGYWAKRIHIGFCGRLIPCMLLREQVGCRTQRKRSDPYLWDFYFYSNDSLMSFIEENEPEIMSNKHYRHGYKWVQRGFKKYFTERKDDKIFFQYKVPCFSIDTIEYEGRERSKEYGLILNPCLAEYDFYKYVDTFTTFQEIFMYLSGVLGLNDPETVDISDKDMRDQKGFDDWSFKKLPTKKR